MLDPQSITRRESAVLSYLPVQVVCDEERELEIV